MGGASRIIRRVFAPSAPAPAPVQQVVSAVKPGISGTSKISKVRGQGSGVTGTIMTSSEGIEEEANVSKAQLGEGTILKKKKYKV